MASNHTHPAFLDSRDDAARFIAGLANVREIAIDTEGASFHRFVDRIYLLQLSTREHSAIVDPLAMDEPPGLRALLENPAVEVVFHDADYDLRLLHQDYGWHVSHIFDTRIAAQLIGLKAFGLAALLEQYFGVKLDKKHQRADWSMRPLSADMLDYAAQDTRFLLELKDRLRRELERLGRWEWAKEEFMRLEGTQWPPEDAAGAFLRLKGARDLNRRELALLRELVPWRDATAREMDRATFRVVSNETLLEIARQAPTTREALAGVKGMPRGMVERFAAPVLDAVARGLAVPDADLPRFPRAPRWERDADFDDRVARLRSARDAAAQRLELDPGVLCARDRLEAVARRAPRTLEELGEVRELRRWQAAELGPAFVKAIGKKAAAVAAKEEDARAAEGEPEESASPYRD